jgi:hypothetical protein
MSIAPFADTKEYVDPLEASVGLDGSRTTISVKSTVIKDVPEDAMVSSLIAKLQRKCLRMRLLVDLHKATVIKAATVSRATTKS